MSASASMEMAMLGNIAAKYLIALTLQLSSMEKFYVSMEVSHQTYVLWIKSVPLIADKKSLMKAHSAV